MRMGHVDTFLTLLCWSEQAKNYSHISTFPTLAYVTVLVSFLHMYVSACADANWLGSPCIIQDEILGLCCW